MQLTARQRRFEEKYVRARTLLRSDKHWERMRVRRTIIKDLLKVAEDVKQVRLVANLFDPIARNGIKIDDSSSREYIGMSFCHSICA